MVKDLQSQCGWLAGWGLEPPPQHPASRQPALTAASRSLQAAKPRPTPATSIPGLLALFQHEWDATVLELHQLRQSLHTARQELSHALYQHDAATRVIARLIRERDGYRAQLEAAERAPPPTAAAAAEGAGKRGPQEMEVDEAPAKKVCGNWHSQSVGGESMGRRGPQEGGGGGGGGGGGVAWCV